jgi:glycosyltransferase involved in cell wall biosynthesis
VSDLVIIVPMLGRPQHIPPLLESIYSTTPDPRILFVVSPDDYQVHAEVDRAGVERITVAYSPIGDYARKINAGYLHTTEPLLFLGASDLRFHPGWYDAATARLTHGVGVVGTNDLGSKRVIDGQHSTHSLVTREYIDNYGTVDRRRQVLCELYWHEYVDDEFIETARHRGAFAAATDSIVEHLHPNWGKGENDATYAAQRSRMARGVRIFRRRRPLWT